MCTEIPVTLLEGGRMESWRTLQNTPVSGDTEELLSSSPKCEYSNMMKVKVTSLWAESAGNNTCVNMCTCNRQRLFLIHWDLFVFILRLVCGVLPLLHNSTPHDHPSAPSVSASFSSNLSVPVFTPEIHLRLSHLYLIQDASLTLGTPDEP